MTSDPEEKEVAERDRYTHGHHESVLRSHTWRTVDNSAAYLEPYLLPGLDVLDIGCGPGTITVDIAVRVAPGRVVGIDVADEIVQQARGLVIDNGLDNVDVQTADAYALPFPDDTFDIVHAHQTLQHLARPVDALREALRVLRPGGLLAVRDVDYGGVTWFPAIAGLDTWIRVYHEVHAGNGGTPDAGRALKSWVRAAGFVRIECSASVWCFASDAEREWWGDSWATRATESTFSAHAIEGGMTDLAGLHAIAEGWREWRDSPDGWLQMPHGEVLARKPGGESGD